MIDTFRDVWQDGKPIVVNAEDWRGVEVKFRRAKIQFWGWRRFRSDDGADCIGVSVPGSVYVKARAIAGMPAGGDSAWGILGKVIIVLVVVAIVAFVLLGGAS